MAPRKRAHDEIEEQGPAEPTFLDKLRSTWELANLMQYIYLFGRAVKIDENLDIEDLERECCKPEPSTVLSDIGLALLKYVSSHRGLTPELFDEYTRRQYVAKAPLRNPFGVEEDPKKFADFDVFLKLRILVQLSQWTLNNADRIREKMEERGEMEQSVSWRMNEIGYDRQDRYYFVLDDNRLYRRTEEPLPPPPAVKPKANSKKAKAAARASKRRRTREHRESSNDAEVDTPQPEASLGGDQDPCPDSGFGGRKWECVAVNLGQYQDFLESIKKSRDADEMELYRRITAEVMPVIESAEASQMRKKQKQERELLNMQKLAGAKRSSRLEEKTEKDRQEREAREAEIKRKADLFEAQAFERRQAKMEQDRESRMMTREQRLKEREVRRILHEEELARMSEEEKKVDNGEARLSERHLKAEITKKKEELAALEQEDEWTFDCAKCGQHGTNWDDGTHSVACEKCSVWQHSACLGISKDEAEKDDFHFVCQDCKRREEDALKPKIPSLKFRVNASISPPEQKPKHPTSAASKPKKRKSDEPPRPRGRPKKVRTTDTPDGANPAQTLQTPNAMQNGMHNTFMNGTPKPTDLGFPLQQPAPYYSGKPQSGSLSPIKATGLSNGYGSSYQPNGHAQAPNQSFQPPPFVTTAYQQNSHYHSQGNHPSSHGGYKPTSSTQQGLQLQHGPAWSARYVPPTQAQAQAQAPPHSPFGPPPASQNPFASAGSEQRPLSSHRPTSSQPSNDQFSSPLQNAPALSPPQYKTPTSSFEGRPPSSSATPQVNGYATSNIANHQPVGPPSQSPMKLASPPMTSSRQISNPVPSSSPVAHQPLLLPTAEMSPGYSPVKHDSPRPQTNGFGLGLELSVTAKLTASPLQQNPVTLDGSTPLPSVAKLAPNPLTPSLQQSSGELDGSASVPPEAKSAQIPSPQKHLGLDGPIPENANPHEG